MLKSQYSIYCKDEIIEKLRKLAYKENRSLNNFIETILQNYLDNINE